MFESFQDRPPSKRTRIVPVALVVVGLTVALVGYAFRGSPRIEPPEVNDLVAAVPSFPSPAPDSPVRLTLPGMSIEAPSFATVKGDYVTGSVQSTSPIEWAVTWQHGALPPLSVLESSVNGMIRVLDARTMSPTRVAASRESALAGSSGRTFELVNERGLVSVVVFGVCGGRVIQIISGGAANARETTAAMVDSFQCKPDTSQDLDREAVVVDAGPGWRRTAATGQPMLVNARELVVRPSLVAGTEAGPLEQLVPIAIRAGGFTIDSEVPEERGGRKLWSGSLTLSGKKRRAAVVAWRCVDDGRLAAVYVVSVQGAPLDDGIALALTGRCLRPGEKAPEYPVKGAK